MRRTLRAGQRDQHALVALQAAGHRQRDRRGRDAVASALHRDAGAGQLGDGRALPILSFTLRAMFERVAQPRAFSFDLYQRKLGGIAGSVQRVIDSLGDDLPVGIRADVARAAVARHGGPGSAAPAGRSSAS